MSFNKKVFCWDQIPGNDIDLLKNILTSKYLNNNEPLKNIEKIDDNKIIRLNSEKKNFLLKLNNEKTKVVLEINDIQTKEFTARIESGKLNIYDDDVFIIIKEDGYPLEIYQNEINLLKENNYEVFDDTQEFYNKERQKLVDISFAIYKHKDFTKIVAQILGRRPEDNRDSRYYFLYYTKVSCNLSQLLNYFINNEKNEGEKLKIKKIPEEQTHFLFDNLERVIFGRTEICDFSKINEVNESVNGKTLTLKSESIDKVIQFLIELENKHQQPSFIIYRPPFPNYNIYIDKADVDIFIQSTIGDIELVEDKYNQPLEPLIGHIDEANINIHNQNILKTLTKPVTIQGKTVNSGKETKWIIGSFLALITIAFLIINSGGWILEILFGIISLIFAASIDKYISYCKECKEIFDFELNVCPTCSSVLTKETIEKVKEKLKMEGKSKQRTNEIINTLQKSSKETLIKPVTIEGKTVNYGRENGLIIGGFLASSFSITLLLSSSGGWILWIFLLILVLALFGFCQKHVSYCNECNEIFDFEINNCPLCSSILSNDTIDDVKEKLKKGGKSKQTTTGMIDIPPSINNEEFLKGLRKAKIEIENGNRIGAKENFELLINKLT